ncbi:cAMP-dependent Kef-type K+ transporter [Vibrio phage vB_VpaM_sm033]|nr:cAMP-dependent Kef-type K+ transporter [Vibrio phage vB_VpaM_sm033]
MISKLKRADRHGRLELPLWFVGWTALFAVLFTIVLFAVGIYHIEVNKDGANIQSFSDALWLGVMTVSTVGYGDRFATSDAGRVLVTAFIFSGPILLGLFMTIGQGIFRTNANVTNREQMSVMMEQLRLLNVIQGHLNIDEPITADAHGLDEFIFQTKYNSLKYKGWITLGKDNTGTFVIAIVADSKKDGIMPLKRHIYATDDYDYAWNLMQFYIKDERVF